VARSAVRSLWVDPRALQPPVRVWRDWALVGVFIALAVLEGVLRRDVAWAALGTVQTVALAFTLLWRRTHPLPMLALAFGVSAVVGLVVFLADAGGGSVAFISMVYFLVLVYAVFRWGSGRAAVIGSVIALTGGALSSAMDRAPLDEALFGVIVLALPAILGASVRLRAIARLRAFDEVRLREREQLARELHDTVAHHVSAMVVRAQAGRVLAPARPGAAVEALEVIEAEGARTLAELRTMVGVLRAHDEAELAPQRGVADVDGLARTAGEAPLVEVHRSGDLDNLSPSVGAASYRIAQESVTNATRHARHATRIVVQVTGERDHVRVSVRDDGDPVPTGRPRDGYGLVGMTERATLLGGALHAGPGPDRGWAVDAVLPRRGPTP